jgi:hypothetical protein
MKEYDTYTFTHKSHYNEFAPDTKIEFTTHQEENLDEVIEMVFRFLTACGYCEDSIKRAMEEYAEY